MGETEFYVIGLALAAICVGGTLSITYAHLRRLRKRFRHELGLGKELSRFVDVATEFEARLQEYDVKTTILDKKLRAFSGEQIEVKINELRLASLKISREVDAQRSAIRDLNARLSVVDDRQTSFSDQIKDAS